MTAQNFVYDNIPLSNFGLAICTFNNSSMDTVSLGSQISFELGTVPGREKRNFIHRNYQETITATFQAAKVNPASSVAQEITSAELSYLMRWLNRKDGFHKFKLLQEGYENLYTYAGFNVSKIEVAQRVVGLELTMYTLYPYLLEEQSELTYEIPMAGAHLSVVDTSDEIGHIYPNVTIECRSEGDFSFSNFRENRTTTICNCKKDERITIDGENLIVRTSDPSHEIQDDFNYIYPRIANSFGNRENQIEIGGIDCRVTLQWSPIRKVGF